MPILTKSQMKKLSKEDLIDNVEKLHSYQEKQLKMIENKLDKALGSINDLQEKFLKFQINRLNWSQRYL